MTSMYCHRPTLLLIPIGDDFVQVEVDLGRKLGVVLLVVLEQPGLDLQPDIVGYSALYSLVKDCPWESSMEDVKLDFGLTPHSHSGM